MARRATLRLDDATRAAARELAHEYGCSVSDAIRRSVINQRDRTLGLPAWRRAERARAIRRAFKLFEGNDPAAEIRNLKG